MIVNCFENILIQLLSLKKTLLVTYQLCTEGNKLQMQSWGKSTSGESNGMPSNTKVSAKP
jgi:hypothetical protein